MMKYLWLLVLLVAGTVSAGVTLGPDATMSTNNWSIGSSAQVASGVNIDTEWAISGVTDPDLGDALQLGVQFDMSGDNSKWLAGTVFRSDWTYNPAVYGSISSIDFSGDFTANYGNSFRIALRQDGNVFWQTVTPPSFTTILNSGVTSVSYTNVLAANFTSFGTSTGTLDFSKTGAPITFGYAIRYGSTAAFNNRLLQVNADNLSFTVNSASLDFSTPVAVPDDSGSVFLNSGEYVSAIKVGNGGTSTSTVNGIVFYAGGKTGNNNNYNNVQTQTRNGVTVTITPDPDNDTQQSTGLALGLYTNTPTGDEIFDMLNSGFGSSFGAAGFINIEMTGLTPGQTYRMQTFHLVNTGAEGSRDMVFNDGTETSDAFCVYYDASGTIVTSAVTRAVTFYAAETNKTFYLLPEGSDRCYLNAISLFITGISPYASWFSDYPGLGTATNMTDNPDNDRLNNLAEWALGGDPDDAGDIGLVPVCETLSEDGTAYFQYVHAQRSDAAAFGLSYDVEWSDDLVSTPWANGIVEIVGTNVTGEAFDYVTNRVSMAAAGPQFLNLVIESN